MTTIPTQGDWITAFLDEGLAELIAAVDKDIAALQRERGLLEMELTRRLVDRGARELAHPTLEVRLDYPSPTYDVGKLRALAEIVPPEDYAKAYQPEYIKQVPVAARFDGRQLNTLARKFGTPVQGALELARLPSSPRLRITAKEVASHNDNSQLATP